MCSLDCQHPRLQPALGSQEPGEEVQAKPGLLRHVSPRKFRFPQRDSRECENMVTVGATEPNSVCGVEVAQG